jgi:hypothetical protein
VTASAGRHKPLQTRGYSLVCPPGKEERSNQALKTPSQGIPVPARGALADKHTTSILKHTLCVWTRRPRRQPAADVLLCCTLHAPRKFHPSLWPWHSSGPPSPVWAPFSLWLLSLSPSRPSSRALISEPEDKLPFTGPGNSSCYNNQSCTTENKITLQNKPFRP